MKYSSRNLNDPGVRLPLPAPVKIIVDYLPGGVVADHAPVFYSADPEPHVDAIVRAKGWDARPGFDPADVWVDGGL